MNENAKTKLVLEYTGMDDFSCPVYKDQFGKLWKDIALGKEPEPNLYSLSFNHIDGEPSHANQEVRLKLTVTPQYLKMSIRDDGIGFQENIDRVTQAFYHENPQDDLKHFGMGMYISRIYCERHGGKLLIKNVADGGAEVEAVFKNYVLEEQQQK